MPYIIEEYASCIEVQEVFAKAATVKVKGKR